MVYFMKKLLFTALCSFGLIASCTLATCNADSNELVSPYLWVHVRG